MGTSYQHTTKLVGKKNKKQKKGGEGTISKRGEEKGGLKKNFKEKKKISALDFITKEWCLDKLKVSPRIPAFCQSQLGPFF